MRHIDQGLLPREKQYAHSLLSVKDIGVMLQKNYSNDVDGSMKWLINRGETIAQGLFDPYATGGVVVPYKWEDAATSKGVLQRPHEADAHFNRFFAASELGRRVAALPDQDVAQEVENIVRSVWRHELAQMRKVNGFEEFSFSGKQGVSAAEIVMHVARELRDRPVSVLSQMNTADAAEINKTSKHALAQKLLLDYASEHIKDGPAAAVTMHAQHVANTNINSLHAIHIVRACETILPALRELKAQDGVNVPRDLVFKVQSLAVTAAMSTHGESASEPHQFLERVIKIANEANAAKDLPLVSIGDLKQAAGLAQNYYPGVTAQYQEAAELQDSLSTIHVSYIGGDPANDAVHDAPPVAGDNTFEHASEEHVPALAALAM